MWRDAIFHAPQHGQDVAKTALWPGRPSRLLRKLKLLRFPKGARSCYVQAHIALEGFYAVAVSDS